MQERTALASDAPSRRGVEDTLLGFPLSLLHRRVSLLFLLMVCHQVYNPYLDLSLLGQVWRTWKLAECLPLPFPFPPLPFPLGRGGPLLLPFPLPLPFPLLGIAVSHHLELQY